MRAGAKRFDLNFDRSSRSPKRAQDLPMAEVNAWTWGWGEFGRLGHGDTTSQRTPTPLIHDELRGAVGGSFCHPPSLSPSWHRTEIFAPACSVCASLLCMRMQHVLGDDFCPSDK